VPISSPRILSISPFPPLHIVPPGRRISSPDFRLPAANRARFRRPQWARDTLSPSNLSGFLRCYSLTLFTCLNRHRSAHSTVTRSHRSTTALQPSSSPSPGSNRGHGSSSRDCLDALKIVVLTPPPRTDRKLAGVWPLVAHRRRPRRNPSSSWWAPLPFVHARSI
jgi:hypothetical protein